MPVLIFIIAAFSALATGCAGDSEAVAKAVAEANQQSHGQTVIISVRSDRPFTYFKTSPETQAKDIKDPAQKCKLLGGAKVRARLVSETKKAEGYTHIVFYGVEDNQKLGEDGTACGDEKGVDGYLFTEHLVPESPYPAAK